MNEVKSVVADNLEYVLMVIEGIRDNDKEVDPNQTQSTTSKWNYCGVIDENTGLFYLR